MAFYSKFIPTYYVPKIEEIDYEKLKEQGVKSLFFDLDNTLIAYDVDIISDETLNFLKCLSKDFYVMVVSNSHEFRVKPAVHNLPYLHYAKKPLKLGLKKAIKMSGFKKEETILIGDQIMTDVFGANRLGMRTVLVKPIKKSSDKWITRFNRKIAKSILKGVKKRFPKEYEELIKPYES